MSILGLAPIHVSAKRGHVEVTSEFIKAGIDVNILDEEGNQ